MLLQAVQGPFLDFQLLQAITFNVLRHSGNWRSGGTHVHLPRANLTYRPHSALSTSLTPRYPPPSLRAIHLTPRYPPHRLHLRDSHEKQPARCSLQPSAPRRDRLRCGYSMCKEAGRPLGILHQNP